MLKYTPDSLNELEKEKLVDLLAKEGVEAMVEQPKPELIRLLLLAQQANAPAIITKMKKINKNFFHFVLGVLLVSFLLFYLLYSFDIKSIFNNVVAKFKAEETLLNTSLPTIYEKGEKTYIVYDYPLINVKVVHDSTCKRPECSLESYYAQIKTHITSLVNFVPIDYQSRQGKSLIEEYNLNLLPVFIFDKHIERTDNFEISKKNLELIKNKYILQVPPTNLVNGDVSTMSKLYQEGDKYEIVEYTSFSCRICKDFAETLSEFVSVRRLVKFFNSSSLDLKASVAAECADQQGFFTDYYNILFEKQDDWIYLSENMLDVRFASYARSLGLSVPIFNSCVKDESVSNIVMNYFSEASKLGISAAPTLIVDNNVLVGAKSYDNLNSIFYEISQK